MNPHRKANAFNQRDVPGDPRLLDQLRRQQVRSANSHVTHVHDGTLIIPKSKRFTPYVHPWKAFANGDATVRIGEGRLLSYLDGDSTLASISLDGFVDYAGDIDVTVTGAGVVYGSIPAVATLYPIVNYVSSSAGETGDVDITLLRVIPDLNESITVAFATELPKSTNASIFYWSIATVDLVDGKATIVKQILRHDPMLWSFTEPA